jgi:hypothetical protein
MTIAQFFILSPRGDCIISKDFRGDEHPTMHEDFFRKVTPLGVLFSFDGCVARLNFGKRVMHLQCFILMA